MLIKGLAAIALLILLSLVIPMGDLVGLLDPENIERWLQEAGGMAPVFFVLLMTTAVVLSPIPSLPLTLAAGAFFGPFQGGLYSVLGGLLGASLAFLLARFLGRRLLERVLTGHINFCVDCSDKLLTRVVLVSRLLPFVSFDIVSYGAGLTGMSLRRFVLATALGMIPLTFVYTYFGSLLSVGPVSSVLMGGILVVLFFLLPGWIEKHDFLGLGHHFRHVTGEDDDSHPSAAISAPNRISGKGEKHHEAD